MMPFIEKATPVDCRERAGTGNWVRVDEKGRLTKIKERWVARRDRAEKRIQSQGQM